MPEFRVNYAIIEKYVQRSDKRAKVYMTVPNYISDCRVFSCTDDLVNHVHKLMHHVPIYWIHPWIQNAGIDCTTTWLDERVSWELRSSVFWDPNSNPSEVLPRRIAVMTR